MSKHLLPVNSDSSVPSAPTSITLADGTVVNVDDFVYVQTEYPDDAYFIGRVVEFVYVPRIRQPKPITSSIWQRNGNADDHNVIKREDTPVSSVSSTTQAASMQLRARLAWYHRSKELPVSRAKSKESRLLIATIHADLNPISAIKSKVVVRHTREIHDLNAWKNAPDHFYYNQLFDRYSTRLYDIVPVDEIRNAPQNVLQKLTDTYEFIFAEPQKIADLVSTRRACNICAKWCSVNESLKCSVCDKTYHMQCLDPPLTRKPAKGYSWHCAACLKQSQEQRHESNGSVTPSAIVDSSERKRSTRATQVDENVIALRSGAGGSSGAAASDTESRSGSKRLKTAHGGGSNVGEPTSTPIPRPKNRGLWPFRYFGVYTEIDDVLHDDERIYPRSVSRIGPKYQAIVPDMVSPAGRELDIQLTAKFRKLNSKNQRTGSGIESRDELSKKLSQLTAGNSLNTNTTGGGGGGGGGVGRWHGKSAEQMDLMWDQIEVVRGNGDAQLFFRQPDHLDNDELDMYMGSILPYLQRHFAHIQDFTLMDCQDAALHGLAQHSYDVEEALITIPDCPEAYVRPRDVTDGWNASGVAQFNEYLREYGANLQSVHEAMPMMSRRAVVLRFYLIAKSKLGLHLLEDFSNRNRAAQRRFNLGQGEGAGTNLHIEVASDAGISGVNTPSSSPHITALGERSARRCIHCQQESSARWYPAPADVVMYNTRGSRAIGAQRIICADCREYWQHYAMMPDQETINARNQQSQSANGTKGGSGSGFRGQSRGKQGSVLALPAAGTSATVASSILRPPVHKGRPADLWPLIPCDMCRLATRGSEQPILTCQDCGLCLHMGCSGYPSRARLNLKRWKCSVCTNIANPTISINYECVLCRKDTSVHVQPSSATGASASERRRRPLMWRTSGNNWVHALCAVSLSELNLSFSHGNVIIGGISSVPSDVWQRKCSVCSSVKGAVIACSGHGCREGAHASCAQTAMVNGSNPSEMTPARGALPVLVGSVAKISDGGDIDAALRMLSVSVTDFVARGNKLSVVLKCSKHASSDVDLSSVDQIGYPMLAAAIASMMVSGPLVRGSSVASPETEIPAQSNTSASPPPLPTLPPVSPADKKEQQEASADASGDKEAAMKSKMVAWSSPTTDPVCEKCQNEYSPIWWPMSPVANGMAASVISEGDNSQANDDGVRVLCHRCYSAAPSRVSNGRNMATS